MTSTTSPRGTRPSASKPTRRASEPARAALAVAALLVAGGAGAQDAEQIVITAGGTERRVFETPYAIGVVTADDLRAAGPMVNLSESLSRVPGIVANNRGNYAQDLQINSRGFGARATFGVRGIRLFSDGIPASGPDGQGQVTHFDIAGASRVEVLRGPFTAQFGNSSGGVISLVSTAPVERRWGLAADAGSDGLLQWRADVEAPFDGGFSVRASLLGFEIDGFRPQSSAERTLGNVRLGWEGSRDRVTVVINAVDQPALDPLGLTPAQFAQNPDQTTEVALPQQQPGQPGRYDTRKEARQTQAGLQWRHAFDGLGALTESRLAAYAGRRQVTQWQSIPDFVQSAPTHPGGVIDFDRDYAGVDGRLVWTWALEGGRQAQLVAGAATDRTDEARRGFENFVGDGADRVLGVTGRQRRDENNVVTTRDLFAEGEIGFAPAWSATLGVRSGEVEYDSTDSYIVPGAAPGDPPLNPDDSGSLSFDYTNPVAALRWQPWSELALYVSAGRGFESPTLNELAYRPDGGTGLNSALQAMTSRQVELGAKWRPAPGTALDAAVFTARTSNEIGVASSSGGRTTFRNVGGTERSGVEIDLRAALNTAWSTRVALTWLDATYRDTLPGTPIVAGNQIAGTTEQLGYAEIAWQPSAGAELALEGRASSAVPVNDANTVFAPGYGLLALRARWQAELLGGRLELLGRLDDLADRRIVASVIVNEAQGRVFEPSPGRTWLLSARWSMAF
ncbi:MAG: TonB-dependent receptor [Rubrivivax sp.]|jgi:iron complex outermembrane receptor protein|nr:TonB-dependent receptor [Rubrivivax sp.]